MSTDPDTLFEKCVTKSKDGKQIDCRLGLWGVASGSPETTERYAHHYWAQYFRDGEYNSLLTH